MGFADTPQPDDTGDQFEVKRYYKYYNFASIPVRMIVTSHERPVATEALDKETHTFKPSQHLTKITFGLSADADEITKDEFYKLCDEYIEYWTPDKIEQSKKDMDQFQKLIDEGFFDD